jgi:hypothetical protein
MIIIPQYVFWYNPETYITCDNHKLNLNKDCMLAVHSKQCDQFFKGDFKILNFFVFLAEIQI